MKELDLVRAAPHVRLHRGAVIVIKVGGGSVQKPAALRRFADQIAVVHALGSRVVVVHGGGPQTDHVQRMLGDEPRMVGGRRVTSEAAMRALRMATAGELAGAVVAALDRAGAPAVGVSGASRGVFVASRRPPVVTSEGSVDFGQVGDLERCDPGPLVALLDAGHVPVLCPPASDGAGGLLNVNADLAASRLAVAMGAAKLVLLTDAPGILRDPANPSSLCSVLTLAELGELRADGGLQDGMDVKATAIGDALEGGVGRVHVVSAADPEALLRELYTNQGSGTLVTLRPESAPQGLAEVTP